MLKTCKRSEEEEDMNVMKRRNKSKKRTNLKPQKLKLRGEDNHVGDPQGEEIKKRLPTQDDDVIPRRHWGGMGGQSVKSIFN